MEVTDDLLKGEAVLDSIRTAQCIGKQRHEYRDGAIKQLSSMQLKYTDAGRLNVYGCVFCNGWHVGNSPHAHSRATIKKYMTLENLLRYDFTKILAASPKVGQRKIGKLLIAAGCTAAIASAQFGGIVSDPGAYAHMVQQLKQMLVEAQLIQRVIVNSEILVMEIQQARRFAVTKNAWIPATVPTYAVPTSPSVYGTSGGWIAAVNTGANTAGGYDTATIPLKPYSADVWADMSPAQRDTFSRQYATVELTDAVNRNALAVTGSYRAQQASTGAALVALENKARSQDPLDNTAAALANQAVAAGIVQAQESRTTNHLLATLVDQNTVRMKRERDNDAQSIAMDQAERVAAKQAKPLGASATMNLRWQ